MKNYYCIIKIFLLYLSFFQSNFHRSYHGYMHEHSIGTSATQAQTGRKRDKHCAEYLAGGASDLRDSKPLKQTEIMWP
jgi:hypothetical protein